ncbi:MAG: RNA polymerase sigma factor region1.1 domain-containing protein, partial [Myxococcota bacterium]|nr:RNA polymerase sigma factor region1.1 domain-containing protein [Myxococcota bacterium]
MSKGPFQKLIDKLVRQAGEKAELTYDDLNQAIPRDVVSPDRIDEVILALVERGIEVSDRSGAGKPRPKPSAAPGAPG